jgi:hypothetical protein
VLLEADRRAQVGPGVAVAPEVDGGLADAATDAGVPPLATSQSLNFFVPDR